MTATSMASWVMAPQVAGSHPTAAMPMANRESPMPATTDWVAMVRERRAMVTASPSRSRRSTLRTTSATSDEAVAPRAPMATPTSARARAGASLMPSPTMTVGPNRRASSTACDLLGRCPLGEDLVDADHGADGLGGLGPIPGDHHDSIDAVLAQAAQGARRVGSDGIVEEQGAGRLAVDGDEDADHPVPVGSAAYRPQPRGILRRHPAGLADRDGAAVDAASHPAPGHLLDVLGQRELQPAFPGGANDGGGQHVGRHLVERGGQPQYLVGGVTAAVMMSATVGRPTVSVPVLSNSSTRQRASCSSTAPPLTITPRRAVRDRPETRATGTARISGQGVATTSTATARDSSPDTAQASAGHRQGDGQEPDGVTVGQAHGGGAGRFGRRRQTDDAGVGAVGRGRRGPQVEGAAGVDRPAAHRVARLALDGQRLAGHCRFVDHGDAGFDSAVDGDDLARFDDEQVGDGDAVGGNVDEAVLFVGGGPSGGLAPTAAVARGGPGPPPTPPGCDRWPA